MLIFAYCITFKVPKWMCWQITAFPSTIGIKDYLKEIVSSFKETSDKELILNYEQDSKLKKITECQKKFISQFLSYGMVFKIHPPMEMCQSPFQVNLCFKSKLES